jgi:hypothetical protein
MYSDRKKLITSLETLRGSRVLSYILSDRESIPVVPGFSTQLASEPQLLILDQLKAIGKTKNLDVFLFTRGGATDSVWPLISLLRQYGEHITVFVPFRAHSAGTLICLGADEVVMSEAGELSPIDPTTGNQFNPPDPTNMQNRFGISVEDVTAYFQLASKRAQITTVEDKIEVFKELTKQVHPLALGNVERVYSQIRRLAHSLLELHLEKNDGSTKTDDIIKALTEEFYSHVHAINRGEAIALLGDWVRAPSDEESLIIWDLFNSYANTLSLRNKFELASFMGDNPFKDLTAIGGFIETTELSHVYLTTLKVIQRPNIPPNVQIQVPPGAALPLAPGFTRSYEISPQGMSWKLNEQEI